MRLSEEQIQDKLKNLPGWMVEDRKWIVRKYRFREFLQGVRFVNKVAEIAEKHNHHPMIAIDYKLVTLRLTTWSEQGLTDLDISAAGEYDRAYGLSE
jgi:4a-hydroxytetrahydrobiopterin dehydratase